MSSRGQPQKMMGFVTQRVGSTVSTLCGIAWFAIPGNRSSRRPHGWCEICNELSRLILSVCNAMSELQPLLARVEHKTANLHRLHRAVAGQTWPCTSLLCFEPCASPSTSSSRRALLRTCGATRASPWVQRRPCTRRRALLAWPGLASRLHLHVLTARSALATSPAGRASNWRLRHFGTSRRCDDDSTAPRHFVTGRFSRPFLGNWEPRLFSFASPPFANKPYEYDDHGDDFTCLLIYYFIHLSLLLAALFAISYQMPINTASLHPCMHCRLFFYFLLGPQRQDGYR